MSIRETFFIELCEQQEIKQFVEEHHYSKSINGVDSRFCFKLINKNNGNIIGAAIFGRLAMANVYKKYVDNIDDILELRRLCCINDTPKNTESFFISQTLKFFLRNTQIKFIISYADNFHNHSGIIYKASNFKYIGKTSPARYIKFNDKLYHDKSIRTYHINKNGEKVLKPFAIRLKNALDSGLATYVDASFKHIYLYNLNEKRKKCYKKVNMDVLTF